MTIPHPSRRAVMSGLAGAPFALSGSRALAQGTGPIRFGDLHSYGRFASAAVPYRNAMQLAVDEINKTGGINSMNGRPLEVIFRDDGATPSHAVRAAEELVTRENASFISGAYLSSVGLALSHFANQRKLLYLATEPLADALTMESGNRYTFRMRPNTYMQTNMLVDAVKAKGVKRWAIVAPNYELGHSAAASFKRQMAAAVPGFEVVTEQFPALERVEAPATVGALLHAKPDAIFNVLWGDDLHAFVREGKARGLFENQLVVSLHGEPEHLLPMAEQAPEGWIVTGYPGDQIDDPKHKAFVEAYRARFNGAPHSGSLLGYVVSYMIRDMLEKAKSTETEAMIAAFEDLRSDTIVGPVTMRGIDHQATLGFWVGETALKGRQGTMKNFRFEDGAKHMHPEAEVRATRKL